MVAVSVTPIATDSSGSDTKKFYQTLCLAPLPVDVAPQVQLLVVAIILSIRCRPNYVTKREAYLLLLQVTLL